jgi:hypothetical protein
MFKIPITLGLDKSISCPLQLMVSLFYYYFIGIRLSSFKSETIILR